MSSPKRPWLTRNLIVLSLVSLTQDAASELMYPLLPLFVTGVLAAPAIALGAIEGTAELATGLSKFYAGRASDRIGRKRLITTGYGLAALGKVFVASAAVWPMVVFGRVVDRIGKGVRSAPRDAMITNSVDREHYSKALGFHRSADTFGAVLGPLVALVGLALLNNNVRAVMWWALVPAVMSMGLTFFVREVRIPKTRNPERSSDSLGPTFWKVALPLIAISAINIPDTMLLLRVSQLGVSQTHVVLAYVAYNLVYTASAYPAGIVASRMRPRTVYSLGMLAFGLTYFALGRMTHSSVLVFIVVAVYGFFPALTDGIGKSIIALSTPKEIHGTAQGVFQSLTGGSILFAGLWAGAIWSVGKGHGSLPFTIAGILGVVGAIYLYISDRDGM